MHEAGKERKPFPDMRSTVDLASRRLVNPHLSTVKCSWGCFWLWYQAIQEPWGYPLKSVGLYQGSVHRPLSSNLYYNLPRCMHFLISPLPPHQQTHTCPIVGQSEKYTQRNDLEKCLMSVLGIMWALHGNCCFSWLLLVTFNSILNRLEQNPVGDQ